MSNIAEY